MKRLPLIFALCVLSGAADATTLISTASGNIDSTATWSVVDTTGTNAFLNSEAANQALTTSPVASSTFTPASETVTAIGVKLASVAATPSGTLTVKLANSTSAGNRECTKTVNVADLTAVNSAPTAATADGGWAILTCSAVPNGTDSYTITINTSVAAQVNLFSLTTTNWSRMIVTNGTKTSGPAAGDKFYVYGQLTAAGTHSAFTVTIETTSLVNYGNVANTLVDPSIAVGQFGTLAFATTASTNFVSEFAGPLVIYNGGTFTVGTAGTPVPSTGKATLTLNSTVQGDTGINVRNGGTLNSAGSSGGRSFVKTHLSAQATASTTSTLTTQDSTGWLAGDLIYIAGTVLGGGQGEAATVLSNASGTSLPISAAVSHTHTAQQLAYTSTNTGVAYSLNMYADVILLNRNVIIQGSGSTTNGYIFFQPNSAFVSTWTEFTKISGMVAGQRGIEAQTGPLGTFNVTFASFVDSHDIGVYLDSVTNINFGGTPSNYVTIQHASFENVATDSSPSGGGNLSCLMMNTSGSWSKNPYIKFDDIAVLNCANNFFGYAVWLAGVQMQFTNISLSGSGFSGNGPLSVNGGYDASSFIGGGVNTWGPINSYSNTGGVVFNQGSFGISGTINGFNIWHESGRFTYSAGNGNLVFDPFYIVTSAFGIYNLQGASATFRNGVIAWDDASQVSGSAAQPLTLDATNNTAIYFDNMDTCLNGTVSSVVFVGCSGSNVISLIHDMADCCTPNTATKVFLRNTSLQYPSSPSPYPTLNGQESYYSPAALVVQDCIGCTIKHASWVQGGFLSYDAAISHVSGFSLRMTPRVNSFQGFIAGQTLTIPTHFPNQMGDALSSTAAGFVAGTSINNSTCSGGSPETCTVNIPQTVGSSGSPQTFLSYTTAGGSLIRAQSAPAQMGTKVAVASGVSAAQACVWLRPSINTDSAPLWGGSAVTYNGDAPRLIVRANPYMGVLSDTVLTTSSLTAGVWSQVCGTLPTSPADGEFEVVVDADQTSASNAGGSVNVAEWTCTLCSNANNTQFWWNGTPPNAVAPSSSGGSHIIGG